MKDLIKNGLDEVYDFLIEKMVPKSKKITKSVSIIDVKPIDIISFMKDNNIPDDACFDGRDNGYDAWDDILLSWDVSVETTSEEKLRFKRKRFGSIAFKHIYNLLTKKGYKRVGVNSALFKEYRDITVYDMYINKDFDKLVKYYSLFFKKE